MHWGSLLDLWIPGGTEGRPRKVNPKFQFIKKFCGLSLAAKRRKLSLYNGKKIEKLQKMVYGPVGWDLCLIKREANVLPIRG